MVKNALLEIGTEELPASYIPPAMQQMAQLAEKFLTAHGLQFGKIATYATPRRLALFIEGLAEKSEDRVEEITGPAAKAGRDAAGNFTMAAQGFAAKHGLKPEKLSVKTTDKGEYLCVSKKFPGEKAEKLLAQGLPELIGKIYFPKTMLWEPSGFRFARPLRTIIALFGDKVIKFSVAGVKSNNWTSGLHAITKKKITVKSAETYLTALRNNCVLADPMERKEALRKNIEGAAKRAKGDIIEAEDLVEEVNYLVEHPVAILGSFDEKYLRLPPVVLITCLKKKQKFFAVQTPDGKLTNSFIGSRNGISENQETVREGYERVLTARLADAEFFFHKDTQTPLASKADKLKGVVFQQKLGTVADKMQRVEKLALYLSSCFEKGSKFAVAADDLQRACLLAKADLTADMVYEYPELQGAVGRIYAAHDGEKPAVAQAVEEHYWPLTADGKLPDGEIAVILALADKIDTLVGDFAVGLIPSGSQDPYGLRRLAAGIVRIVKEKELPLALEACTEKAFALLPDAIKTNTAAVKQVMDFYRQRLENLWGAEGYRFDEIRAVTASDFSDIIDAGRRLAALKQIRSQADFAPLAAAFKRASNILRQADKIQVKVPASVSEELFKEEAERNLYLAVKTMESEVQVLLANKDYFLALQKMVGLKGAVDGFFEKVMVMTEDQALRANRLAILNYAISLFSRILDFSQLQG
jgi:glycyl-tRNA synthetase beta chain